MYFANDLPVHVVSAAGDPGVMYLPKDAIYEDDWALANAVLEMDLQGGFLYGVGSRDISKRLADCGVEFKNVVTAKVESAPWVDVPEETLRRILNVKDLDKQFRRRIGDFNFEVSVIDDPKNYASGASIFQRLKPPSKSVFTGRFVDNRRYADYDWKLSIGTGWVKVKLQPYVSIVGSYVSSKEFHAAVEVLAHILENPHVVSRSRDTLMVKVDYQPTMKSKTGLLTADRFADAVIKPAPVTIAKLQDQPVDHERVEALRLRVAALDDHLTLADKSSLEIKVNHLVDVARQHSKMTESQLERFETILTNMEDYVDSLTQSLEDDDSLEVGLRILELDFGNSLKR